MKYSERRSAKWSTRCRTEFNEPSPTSPMPRTINALNTHTVGAIENGRSLSNRTPGTELVITLISYGW